MKDYLSGGRYANVESVYSLRAQTKEYLHLGHFLTWLRQLIP